MSEKLIIDWNEYNKTVEKLAIQIYESGYKPTILIGIMRGAAPIIDVLSRVFKLKDNPWIVQPFEHYEEIRIEDIKKKHHK